MEGPDSPRAAAFLEEMGVGEHLARTSGENLTQEQEGAVRTVKEKCWGMRAG